MSRPQNIGIKAIEIYFPSQVGVGLVSGFLQKKKKANCLLSTVR
jgi:hypothetical protein